MAAEPLSIVEAVECGDRLAELKATHLRVATAVQNSETPARDLASLTRRQLEISKEIEALQVALQEEADESAISEDEEFDPASI